MHEPYLGSLEGNTRIKNVRLASPKLNIWNVDLVIRGKKVMG